MAGDIAGKSLKVADRAGQQGFGRRDEGRQDRQRDGG